MTILLHYIFKGKIYSDDLLIKHIFRLPRVWRFELRYNLPINRKLPSRIRDHSCYCSNLYILLLKKYKTNILFFTT